MKTARLAALLAATLPAVAHAQPPERAVPYWASISAGEARMRTGPGRQFPAIWLYRRAGLPVKVLQVVQGWRRVQDQDGAVGWMLANLLSETRTGVITGAGTEPLRASPEPGARVVWEAEPGVVGRIASCADGWCAFDVKGKRGFVATDRLWGVAAGEVVK
ncbi:SH3 domain-containing protein [Sphingomonas quercus]|uniref:SH3b domain-containing protein n=1 Tax=Sphingomonas quercus TaxID=2842451 RepID=A0ABS6BGC1_9SPHN|nr:SH3 domain-containing protein [Sphingomonas quercus]MBU3076627.1 hypothetical protein [Sphingomonas quercus]